MTGFDEEDSSGNRRSPLAPHDNRTRHVKPVGPRVLVRLESGDNRSSGGLYLPAGAKEATTVAAYGIVVEVARASEDGDDFGENVSGIPEGAKVLFPKDKGLPVPWDDNLLVIDVKDINAIVDEIERSAAH